MKVATVLLVAVSVLAHNVNALTIEKRDGYVPSLKLTGPRSEIDRRCSSDELTPVPIEENNEGSVTCNQCSKDAGICCPVECPTDGHCPSDAVANAGW
ncbi:hypothetical protein A1O7_09734 [Cladophialophora yegresii CBS 114405]|uniref:4Fe-4S ferredoxin-type domain-containing protein n=1 Tax=Cladophialophora yegresii CBS 114405 TaxID=1182544 RepID=W9VN29_9EURO|nr:uncharacterized protein A1O7_09734 [Cladophialophora yegresii CBS 114405]EXJ54395.1 hypothetical protein A1O7_09734 [Cladophialophora yegresii CBS 114405]